MPKKYPVTVSQLFLQFLVETHPGNHKISILLFSHLQFVLFEVVNGALIFVSPVYFCLNTNANQFTGMLSFFTFPIIFIVHREGGRTVTRSVHPLIFFSIHPSCFPFPSYLLSTEKEEELLHDQLIHLFPRENPQVEHWPRLPTDWEGEVRGYEGGRMWLHVILSSHTSKPL